MLVNWSVPLHAAWAEIFEIKLTPLYWDAFLINTGFFLTPQNTDLYFLLKSVQNSVLPALGRLNVR